MDFLPGRPLPCRCVLPVSDSGGRLVTLFSDDGVQSESAWQRQAGPDLLAGGHFRVRPRQKARQDVRPTPLPVLVGDQILANLDQSMRQAAPLAMDRNGVVGLVAHGIG